MPKPATSPRIHAAIAFWLRHGNNSRTRPDTVFMPESKSREDSPARPLLDAVARLMVPIARLLIARGVSYQVAAELLKRVFVAAARKHFGADDATGTRLSLLTGLNRKEIRRLTSAAEKEKRPEDIASFASATHAVWRSVRRWRDRDGQPKPLPRRSTGRQVSFDDLVRSITLDHRPAAVLEELVRLGYVNEDANGVVHLNADAFLTNRSFNDRLLPLGENIEDHANAAIANVLATEPQFLERSVFSDELSDASVAALATHARAQWARIHDETIAHAIALEKSDAEAGLEADMRIRVGMYFYAERKSE